MAKTINTIDIAIVDDHQLFRKGLIGLLEAFDGAYKVLFEASNGQDLQTKLKAGVFPDIILLDINMPSMDGFETVTWLNSQHPELKVLVISMVEREESIVRMLKLGVSGYLTKNVNPIELNTALQTINDNGYYYTDFITGKLIHSIRTDGDKKILSNTTTELNHREKAFLELACSELTYQEIADKMFLSPKTIDGYRNALFDKFQVKSRTGLALYAVKNGLVTF
jgi:two-component system invasion response regulator UvrY